MEQYVRCPPQRAGAHRGGSRRTGRLWSFASAGMGLGRHNTRLSDSLPGPYYHGALTIQSKWDF
ncbi:hypothetical protein CHELA40_11799 [Chelatococcus asaccharovorans]|nr:hypothetical protein CHELA40_11799 [Chelatococcus asaccharovorans]CAH1684041.1 hypothetical protein CHELA17_63801 [Chelatococcus asaccharovorans]